MKRVSAGALLATIAGFVAACNALTGVSDLEASGLDDGVADAGATDGSSGQAVTDSNAASSSGVIPKTDASSSSSSTSSSSGGVTCASQGGTCAPLAPADWEGPFVVFDQEVAAAQCPIELPVAFELGAGTPSGSFSCEPCRCEPPTGGSCDATLSLFADGQCNTPLGLPAPALTCANATTAVAARFRHVVDSKGACTARAGDEKRGPIEWTTTFRFCGSDNLSAVGCGAQTERCLPPTERKDRRVCILREGAHSCPAPWTANKTTVFDDVDDSRSCSGASCSCGAPSGVGCRGEYRSFAAENCSTFPFPFATTRNVDTCFAFGTEKSAKALSVKAEGGTCAPSGTPTVTGALTASAPGTVCCLP